MYIHTPTHTCAHMYIYSQGFPGSSTGKKNLPVMQETLVQFLDHENPWRRDKLPTPVFPGFPGALEGKEFNCNVGDLDLILGLQRSCGEGRTTHSSILAWRIPLTK